MKSTIVGGLLLVAFFGSLEAAHFDEIKKTAIMPESYCPGRVVTLGDAMNLAEINALSAFYVDFKIKESSNSRMGAVCQALYSSYAHVLTEYLAVRDVSNVDLIMLKETYVMHAKKGGGEVGSKLASIREELVKIRGMKQVHFDWIQQHKTESAVATKIIEILHRRDGNVVKARDLFAYVEAQV